jgi:hypothetical protein
MSTWFCELSLADFDCNRKMPIDAEETTCPECGLGRGVKFRNTHELLPPSEARKYHSAIFQFLPVAPLVAIVIDFFTIAQFEVGDCVDALDPQGYFWSAMVMYVWTAPIRVGDIIQPTRMHLIKYLGWSNGFNSVANQAALKPYTGAFDTYRAGYRRGSRNSPDAPIWHWHCHSRKYDAITVGNTQHKSFDEFVSSVHAFDECINP